MQIENRQNTNLSGSCRIWQIFVAARISFRFMLSNQKTVRAFSSTYEKLTMADAGWWGMWGTPERWVTSPTRGREILVFTCNPGDAGWGPKWNHLVTKHAHNNVVVASKTLVWFSWLAWLFDSTPKLSPALSTSSAFWWFWRWNRRNNSPRWSDLITPVRWVALLRNFHIENSPHRSGLTGQADR